MYPQTTPSAPKTTWPGAFGIFKYSKQAVMLNLGAFLGLIFFNILASVILNVLFGGEKNAADPGKLAIMQILSLLVSAVFAVAGTDLELGSTDGQKLSLGQTFRKVGKQWLKMLGLILLTAIIIVGSLLALIIPFFFVLPRILLAPYFLVDKNLGPIEALRASWNQTKGHSGKAWGIIGASIVMFLPALTIIGIPVAVVLVILYIAAFAVLYRYVVGLPVEPTHTTSTADTPTAPTAT